MTDSLLALGWEVPYKRYHTGELVEICPSQRSQPDWAAISARAKNKKGPKPGSIFGFSA